MILIGDIHADFVTYFNIIKLCDNLNEPTIQLGDFGLGFTRTVDGVYFDEIKRDKTIPLRHKVFRGNHDNPNSFKKLEANLGDYGIYKEMFFIAGGFSIDKSMRTPMVSWWPNEELSMRQFDVILKKYEEEKPLVVISHECPQNIKEIYLCEVDKITSKINRTRTAVTMERMLEIWAPSYWIFAHYHPARLWENSHSKRGTTFVCIPICGMYKVPLF